MAKFCKYSPTGWCKHRGALACAKSDSCKTGAVPEPKEEKV